MALVFDALTIPAARNVNAAGRSAAERQLAAAGSRSVVPLVYGRDRLGGLVLNVLPASAGSTTLLVQVLWCFACDGGENLLLNDQALPAGSTVTFYDGTQTTADAAMVTAMAAQGITYTATLAGYAYTVIAMPAASFTGELNFTATARGRRLYDPRLDSTQPGGSGSHRLATPSTWAFSDNPALALADLISNTVYGAGVAVNWVSVQAAANHCDALIGSPAEKRRVVGVSFTTATELAQAADALRVYAGCFLLPSSAGVTLLPDQDASPVATYSHASGEIAAMEPLALRGLSGVPTAVEVIYTDTTKLPWRDASATASLPGAGSTRPWRLQQLRLPGVQRYSQALREATERLNKLTLGDMSTVVEVFDIGIRHEVGDVVAITHPVGISAKPFRISAAPEMLGPGRWRLPLVEHDPAIYNNTVATTPSIPDVGLTVPGPTGGSVLRLTATAQAFIFADPAATTSPNSPIQFDAVLQGITGTVTWTVTAFNAANTSLGTLTLGGSGNTGRTLTSTNFNSLGATTTRYVRVTAALAGLSDTITVFRGDGGTDAIIVALSNEAHTVSAASDGSSPNMTGSGTTIRVFQGLTELDYDGSGTTAGKWTVSASASGVTVGSIIDSGLLATVGDHPSMSADTATIDYTVSGRNLSNVAFTRTVRQSLSKSRAGTAGGTGASGESVYTATVYRQAASAPATPTGGSFNFTTGALTTPTGAGGTETWSATQPTTTTTPTWAAEFTFRGAAGSTVSGGTWTAPTIDAVAGANGVSTLTLEIFSSGLSATPTSTTATYNFSTDTFTPGNLTAGWTRAQPASSTTPTYRSAFTFSTSTPGTPVTAGTWSTPVIVAQNGSNGSAGADGFSTYAYSVFARGTTSPGTPSGGSYNFSTRTGTPPSGWANTPPAGSAPVWQSTAVARITGTSGTDSALTWSTPIVVLARPALTGIGQVYGMRVGTWDSTADQLANRVIDNLINGTTGSSALASTTHLVQGDVVTLGNGSPWIETRGTYSGATAYRVGELVISAGVAYRCIAATTGNAPPNASFWAVYAAVTGGSAWAGSTSYLENATVTGLNAAGNSTTWIARFAHTSQGSFATERDGGGFTEQRFWNGTAWARVGQVIDGNLLVRGSVAAEALRVLNLSAVSSDLGSLTAGNIDTTGFIVARGSQGYTITTEAGASTRNIAMGANLSNSAAWGLYAQSSDAAGAGVSAFQSAANGAARAVSAFGPTAVFAQSSRDDGTAVRAVAKTDAAASSGSRGLFASAVGSGNYAIEAVGGLNLGLTKARAIWARGDIELDSTSVLISTIATGTAPFTIASTTRVPNLNADMVDGLHAADFARVGAQAWTLDVIDGAGGATATFNNATKPGSASNTNTWVKATINGVLYTWPVWQCN